MPTEIELKLAASPRALADAVHLPWLRKLANGPLDRKKLVSTYFDTPKFKLRDRGLTLRVRKIGQDRLQTVKLNGGAAPDRKEWEAKISSQKPDLKLAKRTALRPLIGKKLKRSLKPVFETDVSRTIMPVRIGGSQIELALDRGRIEAGARRMPVNEIELELKKGNRADLARLARRLADAVPLAYGARPKADRGYLLVAGKADDPVGATPIVLNPKLAAGEAFSLVGLACLRQVAANEEAVRNGKSEGVHQMRVGLRRLRAAISVFKGILQSAETNDLKRELKWLTEQLGPARDFDVLVSESVEPLREAVPQKQEISLLEAELKQKRDAGFDRARAAVETPRYRDLALETALWLIDGTWRQT
jgi:triphosphatase